MDQFPPGFIGPLTLIYGVTGVAAEITVQVVQLPARTLFYGPTGVSIQEDESGVYAIDAFTYPTAAATYRSSWYRNDVLIDGAIDEFEITSTAQSPVTGGRSSMAGLIQKVRLLINDTASPQVFTDTQLQDWLDENRRDVRYLELTPEWQTTGSATEWLNYYDQLYGGDWETDAEIVTGSWHVVVPDTSDWLTGKWSFTVSQIPPLFISGRTYDVYNAAADALESWAASVALDFDVSTGRSNLTASRSQKQAMLLKVAGQYRARGRSTSLSVERGDT